MTTRRRSHRCKTCIRSDIDDRDCVRGWNLIDGNSISFFFLSLLVELNQDAPSRRKLNFRSIIWHLDLTIISRVLAICYVAFNSIVRNSLTMINNGWHNLDRQTWITCFRRCKLRIHIPRVIPPLTRMESVIVYNVKLRRFRGGSCPSFRRKKWK